ncbi:MAG: outer membrane lipoprotein carrier protein LolA [Salinibacter sp.]
MDRCVALLALAAMVLSAGPVRAQSADPSLSDVTEAYRALEGLRATFVQVTGSQFADDSMRITGSVVLSGNKYRVQTPTQTVVTDGATTWIYTPADSQVVVNDAGTGASTITPETFLTASSDRYRVESTTPATRLGAPHLILGVTATTPDARFQSVRLWVRRADRIVTRMQATDRSGSTIDLRLRNITVNPDTLRTGTPFTFSPPEPANVIDLRSGD